MNFFIKSIYGIFVCAVIVLSATLAHSQSRTKLALPDNPFDILVPTDLCEITRSPHFYDGKVLRLRAILVQQIEGAGLLPFDSKDCGDGMRARYDCDTDAACRKLWNRLAQSRNGRLLGRGAVEVTGRFVYRKLLTRRDARLGFYRYEFYVMTVDDILNLPKEKGANHN